MTINSHFIKVVVDRAHVGESNVDIIRRVRKSLAKPFIRSTAKSDRKKRKAYYRAAIKQHTANRSLYRYVMGGLR